MNKKYLAVVLCVAMALMMIAPLSNPVQARNPALMNTLQYRFFSTADDLLTALETPDSAGGVDSMQWVLTNAQYTAIKTNTQLIAEPLYEAGEYEIGINNNYTNGMEGAQTPQTRPAGVVRDPMNFTDFRNAINCLVDKAGVVAGSGLGGFATVCDTQVPDPLMHDYVNTAVTGSNYPWRYNETNALYILWRGGWYSHSAYPTFAALQSAFTGGSLASAKGTANGVVYSGNDPYGQWGGSDPQATVNSAAANTAIAALEGYVRSGDPGRKQMGDMLTAELNAIGCPNIENYAATLSAIKPYVMFYQHYDWATLGYSMGAPPNFFYTELTPVGIGYNDPNSYLVQDTNTTFYATRMFNDPDVASFTADCKTVQYNLVWESYLIPAYCPATYCAYKTGLLGQLDIIGQGTQANGGQAENWITLNARKNNTITYTGPPASTPESNIFYLGIYNPPDQINPTFESTVFDFQVSDEIFTWPIAGNPYTILPGGPITGAPAGGDLPWMTYAWKTQTMSDPVNPSSGLTWTNCTYWFRNDITWQDGVPFTVDDINYTLWIDSVYSTSYGAGGTRLATNQNTGADYAPTFVKYNDYTCSIYVNSTSFLALYYPLYAVEPYHILKYINFNVTAAENGAITGGLNGVWPGQGAASSEILPGAPYTYTALTTDPGSTLIGTGPFMYREGSSSVAGLTTAGGGVTLDGYNGFFMRVAPGAIALKATWLNTSPSAQPSGVYFKVGLSDLVLLANAYGTHGEPPSVVSLSAAPGTSHAWNPAADLAAPSGIIGLSDLVTLATHYGWYYGNYSYNAPYPAAEVANGGP